MQASKAAISFLDCNNNWFQTFCCHVLVLITLFGRDTAALLTSLVPPLRHASPSPTDYRFSMSLHMQQPQNFREAALLPRIYRCAETDCLADAFSGTESNSSSVGPMNGSEGINVILEKAELILDLRSASERDEERAQKWMKNIGFSVRTFDRSSSASISDTVFREEYQGEKHVVRIDVLSPSRLFQYLQENWLTPAEKAMSALYFAVDIRELESLSARLDISALSINSFNSQCIYRFLFY